MSECPLAQSRHFIADECPLLGVKRTLIKSDLRLPAGQIRRMIICRQRGQSPGDSQRRRAATIASTSIRNPSSVNFPTNNFSKSVQTRRPTPWLIQKSVFSGNSATHLFVAETTILANERAQLRRDLRSANTRQGRRGTKPNKQKTIGIVEVSSFRCPPAKHIDLCRRIRICASSFALDLKSKVRRRGLEQIFHPIANLPRLFSASMLNPIFGTHSGS